MKNKVCNKCGENKNVSDFYVGRNQCKECRKEYEKKYRRENKEKIKEYYKKYWGENKEKIRESNKKYQEENKEKIKEYNKKYWEENKEKIREVKKKYREENKEKIRERDKKYKEENKERVKEYKKKYYEENKENILEVQYRYMKFRRKNDPLYRLTDNIRKLIYNSLKNNGYTKKTKTYKILGCSFEDFKKHIESQWEDWMNWDNYGLYNGNECYGWDFDHIIPLSSCECEEDVYKLNHYSNFQPLCSYLNRNVKRDNLDWEL